MSQKLNVAVIFGGASSEHEVSCKSAVNVLSILNKDKYNVYKLGITKDGAWYLTDADGDAIKQGKWVEGARRAVISPDSKTHGILTSDGEIYIDVAFPILHGKNGEDGAIAALLKIAGIPQVTTTMTSGANSMDKVLTHIICDAAGITMAPYRYCYSRECNDNVNAVADMVEGAFDYPVFVKPSSAGSSVGVNKATDRASLVSALTEAAKHDFKILVEQNINGVEVEAAVIGNSDPWCPVCGQIAAADEFYTYDAKYNNAESKVMIPALISEDCQARVRDMAVRVYKALECQGMSRVDFFVTADEQIIFNEINTIPGFTDISMYPKMMAYGGLEGEKLADKLVEYALSEDRI